MSPPKDPVRQVPARRAARRSRPPRRDAPRAATSRTSPTSRRRSASSTASSSGSRTLRRTPETRLRLSRPTRCPRPSGPRASTRGSASSRTTRRPAVTSRGACAGSRRSRGKRWHRDHGPRRGAVVRVGGIKASGVSLRRGARAREIQRPRRGPVRCRRSRARQPVARAVADPFGIRRCAPTGAAPYLGPPPPDPESLTMRYFCDLDLRRRLARRGDHFTSRGRRASTRAGRWASPASPAPDPIVAADHAPCTSLVAALDATVPDALGGIAAAVVAEASAGLSRKATRCRRPARSPGAGPRADGAAGVPALWRGCFRVAARPSAGGLRRGWDGQRRGGRLPNGALVAFGGVLALGGSIESGAGRGRRGDAVARRLGLGADPETARRAKVEGPGEEVPT